MSIFGWEFPPGVTGREPQITGEWPCAECGRTLPEDCDGDVCPDGCGPEFDPDWEEPSGCIGNDPTCSCQDGLGDACHYRDCGDTPAWPVRDA